MNSTIYEEEANFDDNYEIIQNHFHSLLSMPHLSGT